MHNVQIRPITARQRRNSTASHVRMYRPVETQVRYIWKRKPPTPISIPCVQNSSFPKTSKNSVISNATIPGGAIPGSSNRLPRPRPKHPPNPQHHRSPSTEVTNPPTSATTPAPTSSRRDDQNHNPSAYPDGDRWHHTYLYISNPPPKPHKEKEMLKNIRARPLRY